MADIEWHPPTPEFTLPLDRRYDLHHTWAQQLPDGRVRIGLNAMAATLLERALMVIFPPENSPLEKGRPGCWISEGERPISIQMPISGRVHRCNTSLRQEFRLCSSDPYGKGWLLEVLPSFPDRELNTLKNADEAHPFLVKDWVRFVHNANLAIKKRNLGMGPTLPDGGERFTDLRKILGPKAYRNLVQEIL